MFYVIHHGTCIRGESRLLERRGHTRAKVDLTLGNGDLPIHTGLHMKQVQKSFLHFEAMAPDSTPVIKH